MLFLSLVLTCLAPDSIVHEDGTRLVGHLSVEDGQATLRTTHGSFTFPVEDLQQMRTRNELRQTFQKTHKQATTPHARLALSEWCLDQGLYDEFFAVLDEAMADQGLPEEGAPTATEGLLIRAAKDAFLNDHHGQEQADESRRTHLIVEALGESPSRAWVATRWLTADDQAEVMKQLAPRLNGPKVRSRERAVALLQHLDGSAPLNALILMSLKDKAESVQAQARDAVLASGHPGLAKPYLQAAASPSESMRLAAYPVLAALKEPAAVPALIKNLAKANAAGNGASPRAHIFQGRQVTVVQDFEVEIAQGAVIADPVLGVLQEGSLLDVRVHGTSGYRYVERQVIVRSLQGMTGQHFGDDFEAWRRWWNETGLLQAKAARELRQKQSQASQ